MNDSPYWDERDKNLGPAARANRPTQFVELERTMTDPELIDLLITTMFNDAVILARDLEGDSRQWFNYVPNEVMTQVGDRFWALAEKPGMVYKPYPVAEQDRIT